MGASQLVRVAAPARQTERRNEPARQPFTDPRTSTELLFIGQLTLVGLFFDYAHPLRGLPLAAAVACASAVAHAVLLVRPARRQLVVRAFLAATLALLAWVAMFGATTARGPLLFLLLLPLYPTLLDAPRPALVFSVLAIVVGLLAFDSARPTTTIEWRYFQNRAIATATMYLAALVSRATIERVAAGLAAQADELDLEASLRRNLLDTLFVRVSPEIAALSRGLGSLTKPLTKRQAQELEVHAAAIAEALRIAREGLPTQLSSSLAASDTVAALAQLRARSLKGLLAVIAFALVTALPHVVAKGGPVATGLLALALIAIAIWLHERYPSATRPIARVILIATAAIHAQAFFFWGFSRTGPQTYFFAAFALIALILDGIALFTVVLAIELAMIAVYALTPGSTARIGSHPNEPSVVGLTLLLVNLVASTLLVRRMLRGMLLQMRDRHEELATGLVTLRRLVAILFHDLANPLAALQVSLHHLERDDTRPVISTERLVRLVRSMEEIVSCVRPVRGLDAGEVRPIRPSEVLEPLREVFAERLREKEQTLVCVGELESPMLAAPEILRNSVVANLISNAIKFAPRGSRIEVFVIHHHDQAETRLMVCDRGPGVTEAVCAAIATGDPCTPRTGSEGERGRGLGLMIARDFVRRMGGRLELRPRDGGGTEATISLRSV